MPYQGIPYSTLDTRYLRLDCTNDPLTAGLEINAATAAEPVLILQTTDDDATNPFMDLQNSGVAMPYVMKLNGTRFVHIYGTDNLFMGVNAGNFTLTGDFNIAVGKNVLDALTTGFGCIGIGYDALTANLDGHSNVAIGEDALTANTSGFGNMGIGTRALSDNTTGNQNVAVGVGALDANIDGDYNTAIGNNAAPANTSGSNNVALGTGALLSNLIGNNNLAIGSSSLTNNTATGNVGVGLNALHGNTTAGQNVGIGTNTGYFNQAGWQNVLVGHEAGRGTGNHNKQHNVMIGFQAGFLSQTAHYNTLIGYKAGDVITTGDYNIIIGYDIDPSGAAANSELNIGGIIFGDLTVPDVRLGDLATNHFKVDNVGDVVFVGGSGLVFGCCYGNHIAWQQIGAVQNTWYNISIAAINAGPLHNVTHDGNGMLTVTEEGMYLITWSLCYQDDKANDHLEGGIEVSSSGAAEVAGRTHSENKFASEEEHLSSSTILDLADNATIELAIRTTNAAPAPTIDVQGMNISVVQIGGT